MLKLARKISMPSFRLNWLRQYSKKLEFFLLFIAIILSIVYIAGYLISLALNEQENNPLTTIFYKNQTHLEGLLLNTYQKGELLYTTKIEQASIDIFFKKKELSWQNISLQNFEFYAHKAKFNFNSNLATFNYKKNIAEIWEVNKIAASTYSSIVTDYIKYDLDEQIVTIPEQFVLDIQSNILNLQLGQPESYFIGKGMVYDIKNQTSQIGDVNKN